MIPFELFHIIPKAVDAVGADVAFPVDVDPQVERIGFEDGLALGHFPVIQNRVFMERLEVPVDLGVVVDFGRTNADAEVPLVFGMIFDREELIERKRQDDGRSPRGRGVALGNEPHAIIIPMVEKGDFGENPAFPPDGQDLAEVPKFGKNGKDEITTAGCRVNRELQLRRLGHPAETGKIVPLLFIPALSEDELVLAHFSRGYCMPREEGCQFRM
jgi:hypothetical protein